MSGANTITVVSLALGAAWMLQVRMSLISMTTVYKSNAPDLAAVARLISAINHLLDGRLEEARAIYGPDLTEHALAYFKRRYAAGDMALERYERMVDTLLKTADLMERES